MGATALKMVLKRGAKTMRDDGEIRKLELFELAAEATLL
jgi:hypothetical protein